MILDPLFHWSPSERRNKIRDEGLRPYSKPTVHGDPDLAYAYICLSPTPSAAWSLSGDMDWVSEIEEWDLWEIELPKKAEVHVRSDWGKEIREVKVYTAIPADHCWYVGTRTIPVAEEVTKLRPVS